MEDMSTLIPTYLAVISVSCPRPTPPPTPFFTALCKERQPPPTLAVCCAVCSAFYWVFWLVPTPLPVLVEINCSQPVVFDLPGTEILDIDEGLSNATTASAAHASKTAAAPAAAAPAAPASTCRPN